MPSSSSSSIFGSGGRRGQKTTTSSSSSIFGSGGRRGQKTLVVLTATALLAASSLLSVLLAASSLLFAFQDHRQILLQLKSLNDPSTSNADPSGVTNQQQLLRGTTAVTDDVPWFIRNAQWCHDPEDDEHYAPPIDYNDCSNSTLIHMDIVGGMTSYLNKILKVAMWSARTNSCFYINEDDGVPEEYGGKHWSHAKLGYRLINGQDTYMDKFLTRYFDQMGLEKDRFNDMLESGKFDVFTPTPSEIHHEDSGNILTMDDNSKRFELMSIPSLGYKDIDRISLKKHFLRRLFRIKPVVREHACYQMSRHGIENDYIALSVRRGDKVTEVEILNTVDPYIKLAEQAIMSPHFNGIVPTFFVATDDCSVMNEFRVARPKWAFVSECDNASEENGFVYEDMKVWNEEQTDAHFNKFITEMIGMASAKYWIGVPSTNVSYWIYFMRSLNAPDDTFVWAEEPVNPGLPW